MELHDRQALWQGFGNGLGQAVEMVLTPVLLGLFGAWLDHLFGTGPVLMLVFGVVGVLGMAARTYYWYQAKIAAEEEGEAVDAQPEVEREIATDLVKRAAMISPVVILVAGLVSGWSGAASAAIALAIVSVNFLIAAGSMSWAAKISPTMVGGVAAGGYVVRLGLILVALVLLRHVSWISMPWLGFTIVGAHVGLLFWETRYVSLQLAAPGLRPRGPFMTGEE